MNGKGLFESVYDFCEGIRCADCFLFQNNIGIRTDRCLVREQIEEALEEDDMSIDEYGGDY